MVDYRHPNVRQVPEDAAAKLVRLKAELEAAQAAYRAAVADALKAGGSVRSVARVTGLSTNTVMLWGREGGWPTAEQKATDAQRKAKKAAWDAMVEQALNAQKPTQP